LCGMWMGPGGAKHGGATTPGCHLVDARERGRDVGAGVIAHVFSTRMLLMLAGQSVNSEAELCSALRDLRARVAASPVVVDNAAAHSAAGYHVSTD
jgi:hypothetical protein